MRLARLSHRAAPRITARGTMRLSRLGLRAVLLTGLLAGCTVGPDYKRPMVTVPAQFKEAGAWVGKPRNLTIKARAVRGGKYSTILSSTRWKSA